MTEPYWIRALLFDVDGVQCNSEGLIEESNVLAFAEWGYDLGHDEYVEVYREQRLYSTGIIEKNRLMHIDRGQFQKVRHEILCDLVEEKGVERIEGLVRFIDEVRALRPIETNKGIALAAVSANYRAVVTLLHQATGLDKYFPTPNLFSRDNYPNGKADGQMFVAAAKSMEVIRGGNTVRVGVDARHCIVFENKEVGQKAALAAGARKVVAIRGRQPILRPDNSEPDSSPLEEIRSFEDMSVGLLEKWEEEIRDK